MRASQLVYDIPTASEYPNPSDVLRRRGFRNNLSSWVIPQDHIPWSLLGEFTAHGVRWHLLEFATGQDARIIEMCREAIKREITEGRARLEQALARADAGFGEQVAVADGGQLEKAEKSYAGKVRASVKKAERLLKDLEEAARCFGLDKEEVVPTSEYDAVRGLKAMAEAKANAYARLAEQAEGTPMEAAAKADDVPAGVLADYVEERGGDATVARAAFAEPTPESGNGSTVTEPVPSEGEHRLVSGSATVVFTPNGRHVHIVRSWRGVEGSDRTVTRESARKEYKRLLDQGYTRF